MLVSAEELERRPIGIDGALPEMPIVLEKERQR
jgi:hypothetical protein